MGGYLSDMVFSDDFKEVAKDAFEHTVCVPDEDFSSQHLTTFRARGQLGFIDVRQKTETQLAQSLPSPD